MREEEIEVRIICPLHCNNCSISTNPLVSPETSQEIINVEHVTAVQFTVEDSSTNDGDDIHTFVCNYESIKYALGAVDIIYRGKAHSQQR